MSKMKFTPGPWHLCQHLKGIAEDMACNCGYRGVIYGPEQDIAYAICQPGHDRPEREEEWGTEPSRYPRDVELANARLIAAAPELLEALESIITQDEITGGEVLTSGLEAQARNAIAKATGNA